MSFNVNVSTFILFFSWTLPGVANPAEISFEGSRQRPIAIPEYEHRHLNAHWQEILDSGLGLGLFEPLDVQKRNLEKDMFRVALRRRVNSLKLEFMVETIDIRTMQYYQDFDILGETIPEEILPHLLVLATLEVIDFQYDNIDSRFLRDLLRDHVTITTPGSMHETSTFFQNLTQRLHYSNFYTLTFIPTLFSIFQLIPAELASFPMTLMAKSIYAISSSLIANLFVAGMPQILLNVAAEQSQDRFDHSRLANAISQSNLVATINPLELKNRAIWFGYGLLLQSAPSKGDKQLSLLVKKVTELYKVLVTSRYSDETDLSIWLSKHPQEYFLLLDKALSQDKNESIEGSSATDFG